MLKVPLVKSTVVINSFLLNFTNIQQQLIEISNNCIHILDPQTLNMNREFYFDEIIQLATPLLKNGTSYIIVQTKSKLVELSYVHHALHTNIIEESPIYEECCTSLDQNSACFVAKQSILYLGQFKSDAEQFLFAFPRKVILGSFGLAVLFSDSLHQVWIQCTKDNKLSSPQQVQEDIWDLVAYNDQIIAFGTSISILIDPWQGKNQSFVIQNSNIVSVISNQDVIFLSDTCGHLIQIKFDGLKMQSEILFVVCQAKTMTLVQDCSIFLGSQSGDSVLLNYIDKNIVARQPAFSPIHDIILNEQEIICATGMERTGGIKNLHKIVKFNANKSVDLYQNIDNVVVLNQQENNLLFQVNFKVDQDEGNAIYSLINNTLKQLKEIDHQMSEYCRYFGIVIKGQTYIVIVDDYSIQFYDVQGNCVNKLTVVDFAENKRILSCSSSPNKEKIILTLTDNYIAIIDSFKSPVPQHIQIDEIQQQLISSTINEHNVIALIYDQIPYCILYSDNETIIQKLTDVDFSVDSVDINLFSLLEGCIPPNCTRPALLASLRSGKLAACPFSQEACQLQVGVIFAQFWQNKLIIGHKNGEIGIYVTDGLYCLDYEFFSLDGLESVQIINNQIFAIDKHRQQYLLENQQIIQIFDCSIFSHLQNNISVGFKGENIVFLTESYNTYQVNNTQINALSRSVAFMNNYLISASVRTAEIATATVKQTTKSIIQKSGFLLELPNSDELHVESPPAKRLNSKISLYKQNQQVSFYEFTGHHITTLITAKLGRFKQEFVCAGFVTPNDQADTGLILIFDLFNDQLFEKARFTTKQGVYQLSTDNNKLFAMVEQSIIALEYSEHISSFLPPQTHGTPQFLFETGWLSPCVFSTSLSVCDDLIVFTDIAKGVFCAKIGSCKIRTEFKGLKRTKGKGTVVTDGKQIIVAENDGKITVYDRDLQLQFSGDIGCQILTLKKLEEGLFIYGTSGGELGFLCKIEDQQGIINEEQASQSEAGRKAINRCKLI